MWIWIWMKLRSRLQPCCSKETIIRCRRSANSVGKNLTIISSFKAAITSTQYILGFHFLSCADFKLMSTDTQ